MRTATTVLLLLVLAATITNAQKPTTEALLPTAADVRYGRYDRNVLDFYQANPALNPASSNTPALQHSTTPPAPVLVYFHGGGWIHGDKRSALTIAPVLKAGISLVSANYRFTEGTPDAAPYPAPMEDAARAVQFVRSKAQEWNIDPNRIALSDSSAGAVISMWIAYRDDMAKPDSADPIERYSTRVTSIVPQAGPTTFDPALIRKRVGGSPGIHLAFLPFFKIKNISELETDPTKRALVVDASPLTHVTSDDPPTFMQYGFPLGGTPLPPDAATNLSIHHPEFGVMLKEKLDASGVENVLQTKDDGSDPQGIWVFLKKHLKP